MGRGGYLQAPGSSGNPNIRGNRVDRNYADTAALRNDAPDNQVEPVNLIDAGTWPEPAQAISAAAGIEPAFARAREIVAPTDVIVESTSVAFQPVRGAWSPIAAVGRYGAHCQQSSDPDAAARWTPVLPKDGDYDVRVWLPVGGAAATYLIRHTEGETTLALPGGTGDGWETLGRFSFPAGSGAEVTVTRAEDVAAKQPLLLDAIRFTLRSK